MIFDKETTGVVVRLSEVNGLATNTRIRLIDSNDQLSEPLMVESSRVYLNDMQMCGTKSLTCRTRGESRVLYPEKVLVISSPVIKGSVDFNKLSNN